MKFTIGVLGFLLLTCSTWPMSASAQIPQAQATELRAEVARRGSLRLIVTLATDQGLPMSDAAAIAAKQRELLSMLKARGEHQVVFVFPSTPMIALIVGPSALDALLSSPLVAAITLDAAKQPSANELR